MTAFKNLAVNKETKGKRKICKQSFSCFETLSFFTKVSFQHKWNEVQLLLLNMACKTCLTSWQTSEDQGSYAIRKY